MRKQIKNILTLIILLSFICTGQVPAAIATAETSKASSVIFDWKADYSHLSRDYNSVAYGKGVFVAVGEKGIIFVSKDLKKWEHVTVNYTPNYEMEEKGLTTVLFNGDVFVAAGGRNIFYSKDGYHWNAVKVDYFDNGSKCLVLSPDEAIFSGATNGKIFVLSGPGVLIYSKDGANWTKHPSAHMGHSAGGGVGTSFSNVIFDGSKFIAACSIWNEDPGGEFIYTSVNGIDWSTTKFEGPSVNYMGFLTYNGSKYYISHYDYDLRENIIYESDNLKIWNKSQTKLGSILYRMNQTTYRLGDGIYCLENGRESALYKAGPAEMLNGMCEGNGKIVVVGTNGFILYSDSSDKNRSWKATDGQYFKDIYSAAANKACIVAVGKDGQIIRSVNGVKWQVVKTNITSSLHSVIYDGKYFIAAGNNGTLATSSDGNSWVVLPPKTKKNLYAVKKLSNMYIAVGEGATILSSKNSVDWKLVYGVEKDSRIFNEPISCVAYKDGTYYVISNPNSFVYTSKDAVNWSQTSRLKGSGYSDLAYYKGRFVLIGGNMSISKDMKTETVTRQGYSTGYGSEFMKINTLRDYLLTGAPDGKILFSPDGILWQDAGVLKTSDSINSFVEFKGSIYGFSNDCVILRGIKKGTAALNSDITVSAFYNYPQSTGSMTDQFEALKSQPVFRDGVMLLTLDTISNIIGSDSSYDKFKKTAQISLGKKNIQFSSASSYATVNGKRVKMPKKAEVSGSSCYVPAQFTLSNLGYTYGYDSSKRRIFITVDDTPRNNSLGFTPVKLKDTDGRISFKSVGYNLKIFVALADKGVIYTSKDGANWDRTTEIKEGEFSKVLWNGKGFIAIGGTVDDAAKSEALIYLSKDGFDWQKAENIPEGKYIVDGAVASKGKTVDENYTDNIFKPSIFLTADGEIFASTGGMKWSRSRDPKTKYFSGLCWHKGLYYSICRDTGIVYYSSDGEKWNYYKTGIPMSRIFSSGGTLWAIHNYYYGKRNMYSSKLYKSINGKDWTYVNDLPNKDVSSVFYAGNKYILFGSRFSSNEYNESMGFAMVSGSSDLWDFAAVPAGYEFTNEVFRYGKLTILATSKGLYALSVK